MKLEKRRFDDIVILKFTGEFDTFNLTGVSERIDRMIEQGDSLFILDLHLLKFINSAALGYLIKTSKSVRDAGGEMVLARPSKFIKKTLVTLGLEDYFRVYEGVEDAILHFKKGIDVSQLRLDDAEHDESLTGATPILFRPAKAGEEKGPPPNQVGRIVTLYEDGLLFRYEPEGTADPVPGQLAIGARLKMKFRQPFAIKEHYFEMDGTVTESTDESSGDDRVLAVRVRYDKIGDADKKHLSQFVRDQEMWRAELKS